MILPLLHSAIDILISSYSCSVDGMTTTTVKSSKTYLLPTPTHLYNSNTLLKTSLSAWKKAQYHRSLMSPMPTMIDQHMFGPHCENYMNVSFTTSVKNIKQIYSADCVIPLVQGRPLICEGIYISSDYWLNRIIRGYLTRLLHHRQAFYMINTVSYCSHIIGVKYLM